MNKLTQEDWQRIDTFIVRDELINAIQLHRQLSQTSFIEAKDEIYAREDALLKIYPKLIPTVDDQIDECIRRLDTVQEKVSIIEGSWDGDSRGWFIKISAITDQPSNHHPRFTEYGLCIVRAIEDQVDRAMKIGNKIAEHAKVGFYLTHNNPDFSTFDYEKRWWDSFP